MLVDELALFMTEAKIATIPVLDHAQRPLGMVSWADLQGPCAQPAARVRDIMTFGIATVHHGVSLEGAAARLIDQGRERLIVVDDDGAAVGSLSLEDLRGRLLEPLPGEERPSSRGTLVEMDAVRRTRQGRTEAPGSKD
jgi:CBS domain-containing protein